VAITALRDSAYLRGLGDDRAALERLRHAWEQNQGQAALANELVRELARSGAWLEAERALEAFLATGPNQLERVISTLVEAYQRAGREHEAERLRQRLPSPTS
jgi:thioredoxin-like negative regulator of GroEL